MNMHKNLIQHFRSVSDQRHQRNISYKTPVKTSTSKTRYILAYESVCTYVGLAVGLISGLVNC